MGASPAPWSSNFACVSINGGRSLPRAKIHLYYAFRVYLESKGFDINSDSFLRNEKILKELNEKNTLKLLTVMEKAIKNLAEGKEIEYVNVFKKKELAVKIKEFINKSS